MMFIRIHTHAWQQPDVVRHLAQEEVLLHEVLRLAKDDAARGCRRSAEWFKGREYRAMCLALGVSDAAQKRIRDCAVCAFEARVQEKQEDNGRRYLARRRKRNYHMEEATA